MAVIIKIITEILCQSRTNFTAHAVFYALIGKSTEYDHLPTVKYTPKRHIQDGECFFKSRGTVNSYRCKLKHGTTERCNTARRIQKKSDGQSLVRTSKVTKLNIHIDDLPTVVIQSGRIEFEKCSFYLSSKKNTKPYWICDMRHKASRVMCNRRAFLYEKRDGMLKLAAYYGKQRYNVLKEDEQSVKILDSRRNVKKAAMIRRKSLMTLMLVVRINQQSVKCRLFSRTMSRLFHMVVLQ